MNKAFNLGKEDCIETLSFCSDALHSKSDEKHKENLKLMIGALISGQIILDHKGLNRPYRNTYYIPPAL